MKKRVLIIPALTAVAALTLGACTSTKTVETTVTQEATVTESAAAESSAASPSDSAASTAADSAKAQAEGTDPVFAAIDAVLAEYADGVIVNIDREDSDAVYDIDVVTGNQVVELKVNAQGAITEEERESDEDDVRKAQEANVSAADAIKQALESHAGGVLDEADLEEDDGQLHWEIDLDDADRNDLAGVVVNAK